MKQKIYDLILRLPAVFLLWCILFACANIGNPNGGPYDEDPPKFVGSRPAMNQLNYKGKKIEVFFDEYISIENPGENVIVTPPQQQSPFVQAVGKKVTVELKDTLIENTTYTVDFTSSLVDNNEKNALENFSFAFSTGDVLDTLQISGVLMNAEDLEPAQKVLVGIHSNLSDTAFTKTRFLRTSKTDERGRFTIHNITPGDYHLFALEDKNRNYAYDKNNDEALAFYDSIIIPTCERAMVPDTIWRDTVTVDTVLMVEKTLFYPNDLVLWFFRDSITPRQRMLKPERSQDYLFTLKFNAPTDTLPDPVPLNFKPYDSLWYITQRGEDPESFSINYWILDSMIYKMDTLLVEVSYWKNNDTIPDLMELQTDTLSLINRDAMQKKKKTTKKKPVKVRPSGEASADSLSAEEKPPVVPLQVAVTPSGTLNPYDIISVRFNEPVMEVYKECFRLEIGVDSLWEPADFELKEDSLLAMTYHIIRPLRYEERYRLTLDSAILCGVYGHCNDSVTVGMTVKGEKDYGSLIIAVQGLPLSGDSGRAVPAFMELLNGSGAPIAKAFVENETATFKDVNPDKYYARIILDTNENGKWDAGSYEKRRQPESVIYFMSQFEIRQNWKIEETWDIRQSKPGEKPDELIKNKPKEDKKKKRDYKEDSKPKKSNSSTPNIRGIGGLGR
ncbi:MAG: Ig-like domain-containing protein [Tannerella sp.]|jgi:hypothetical protein|nr:Ig-like domain-containing protein [Tannerella sp.]